MAYRRYGPSGERLPPRRTKNLFTRLPAGMHKAFAAKCRKDGGRSMNVVVNELVRMYVLGEVELSAALGRRTDW